MNNLTSLFPPNYKNLEQAKAVKLLEEIEKAVEGMDKGCEYCDFSSGSVGSDFGNKGDSFFLIREINDAGKYEYHLATDGKGIFRITEIYNCPNCGRELRKEEL